MNTILVTFFHAQTKIHILYSQIDKSTGSLVGHICFAFSMLLVWVFFFLRHYRLRLLYGGYGAHEHAQYRNSTVKRNS